jgi:succinyl-diaminopimelate desuccinylase
MPDTPVSSMIEMTRELVRIPSRAGTDPYDPIIQCIGRWLDKLGLPHQTLRGPSGSPVGLMSEVRGDENGPKYVLNAPFDTAPFGDESQWQRSPTSGEIVGGWLCGRGAADSKAGIAVFSHVAADFHRRRRPGLSGTIVLLFDGDEHSGSFRGVQTYFAQPSSTRAIDGVMIGYPGNDRLVIGSRGFLRVHLTVQGEAAHSGSGSGEGANSIVRAARIVETLMSRELPQGTDEHFDRPPKVTVTSISGGEGFSTVPDRCQVGVDIRVTPTFDTEAAMEWLQSAIGEADDATTTSAVAVEVVDRYEAYRVPEDARFVQALRHAAQQVFRRPIPLEVVGPSNIGNYLVELGIPATAGFGVRYEQLHAANERFEVASIEPVYRTYDLALRSLLSSPTAT